MMPINAVATLVLAAAATAAPQIELYEYTVKKGDTCGSVAKRELGARKAYDKIHKHNPWMGPLPHKLKAGMVLKLPREVKGPAKPDAEVTAAHRQVEARSPKDDNWTSAAQGLDLFRGWRVNTLERSFAEVTFVDKSRIQLRENTLVIIYGGSDAQARRTSTRAKLDRGALRSRLGELSGRAPLEIETPSADASMGGPGLVAVDDAGAARVSNHGKSAATVTARSGKKKKVKVPSLMGSKVEKGKDPTRPKPLPATPTWLSSNPTTFVIPAGGPGTLTGQWKEVKDAHRYRIEIGEMKAGGFVMTSVNVPSGVDRFEAHNLPAGEYFATVAAVDNDQFESPPSKLHEASLVPAKLVSPDGVDLAPAPATSNAKPTDAPAAIRVLPGTELQAPSGLSCTADDASEPAQTFRFLAAGSTSVRCVDAKGKPAPGFAVEVVPIDVKIGEGASKFVAVRGIATPLTMTLDSELPLPTSLQVTGPEHFGLTPMVQQDDGSYALEVVAKPRAPATANFQVSTAAGVPVAGFEVEVAERAPPPDIDATPAEKPERHMFEVGAFGGFVRLSPRHELVTTDAPLARNRELVGTSPDIGVRFGYYPLRSFGIEVEGDVMPTRLAEGSRVTMFGVRAHLIGQLPYRVTPYLLVGGGVLGLTSAPEVLGDDTDAQFHFGGGVKFFATKHLAIRLGLRNIALPTSQSTGAANSLQLLFGISGVFRRESAKAR